MFDVLHAGAGAGVHDSWTSLNILELELVWHSVNDGKTSLVGLCASAAQGSQDQSVQSRSHMFGGQHLQDTCMATGRKKDLQCNNVLSNRCVTFCDHLCQKFHCDGWHADEAPKPSACKAVDVQPSVLILRPEKISTSPVCWVSVGS